MQPGSEYHRNNIVLHVLEADPDSNIKITAYVSGNGKTVEVDLMPSGRTLWNTYYTGLEKVLIPGKTVDITLTFRIDGYKGNVYLKETVEEIEIILD